MLVSLSIRDVVLIERLELSFETGLCVLTGETGTGKSILLDALGLALGNRAEAGLVRPGATQASAIALFEVAPKHPALKLLEDHGIEAAEAQVVLRRTLSADGRSRAFINDQPVSVGLLRQVGDSLVEVQGQFEQRGLLDVSTHRELLDAFAGQQALAAEVTDLWHAWQESVEKHAAARAEMETARREEKHLREAVAELTALAPRPGEEQELSDQREVLMNAERLIEAMNAAAALLNGGDGAGGGAETALSGAHRALERVAGKAGGRLDAALEALDRATVEAEEALAQIHSVSADIELDAKRQEEIEARYFALKELARKHGTEVDALAEVTKRLSARLAAIDDGGAQMAALERAVQAARAAYLREATKLGKARREAAKKLDKTIAKELPPLKLERASFLTRIEGREEADWGASGMDRIAFEVATNPGAPPGPLNKIASGGELARFLLALKVVLAAVHPGRTLVFDEVDAGIGGATAHAVGERLARLTADRQVLVVTHSPQVGARGVHHLRVHKESKGGRMATSVSVLDATQRQEEIARMLSGAEITEEARAAARRLIEADAR
jgi:DNA repair protein RecN (Recombination protein N)